jgi:molybdopterin/thiamine biosynthesis adenylyltransferase
VNVTVCGVGALGSHTIHVLRNLPVDLTVVDGDRVESANLHSQMYSRQVVGKNKAEATRLLLLNQYGREARALPVRVRVDNVAQVCGPAQLVLDCFDNAASRQVLGTYCRDEDVPLVHGGISADGLFGLVRWDERFEADEEDREGQATCQTGEHLPLISLVAAALALTVRDFVASGRRRDVMVTSTTTTTTFDSGSVRVPRPG